MAQHTSRAGAETSATGPRPRSLEALPYAWSDLEVVRALRGRFARRPLPAERMRAARLVALVAGVRAGQGRGEPWAVEFALDPEELAHLVRLHPPQLRDALGLLREAGALEEVHGVGAPRYRTAPELWERAATPEAPDWPALLAAFAGEPAALLVARAFADLLRLDPQRPTPVRAEQLQEHTGYGAVTVRKGIAALVERGWLEEQLLPGQPSRYHFTGQALGRAIGPASARPAPAPVALPVALPAPAPSATHPSGATGATPAAGVPLRVRGVEITLHPGVAVEIGVDAEGRPVIRIGDQIELGPL